MQRTFMLLLAFGLAACAAAARPPAEPYVNLQPTKEAVAQAVADAFAAEDVDRLLALAITEVEFRENIWPELPASDPAVGMPVDYVWSDTNIKSRGRLAQTLREFGGTRLTVEQVRFDGPSTAYEGFTIHPETHVVAVDPSGAKQDLRLFGSMVETPGGWKVYSYIVD